MAVRVDLEVRRIGVCILMKEGLARGWVNVVLFTTWGIRTIVGRMNWINVGNQAILVGQRSPWIRRMIPHPRLHLIDLLITIIHLHIGPNALIGGSQSITKPASVAEWISSINKVIFIILSMIFAVIWVVFIIKIVSALPILLIALKVRLRRRILPRLPKLAILCSGDLACCIARQIGV